MMRFVVYVVLAYLAYQFIFNLVIPVYKTSRRIKKGFREMQERMQSQQQKHQQPDFASSSPGGKTRRPDPNDYIEFEEIK